MKRRLAVLATAPLLLAATALAAVAIPCAPSGLARVAVEEDGLHVVEPRVATLQAGDVLVQLNGRRLRTCAELERALEEARDGDVAVLLLVRRGETSRAVAIERWEDQAALAPTSTAAIAIPTATVAPPAPPPTAAPIRAPLARAEPPTSAQTVRPTVSPVPAPVQSDAARQSAADALRFGKRLRAALPLAGPQPWAGELEAVLRAHERRRAANPEAAAADPIFSHYAAALEIAGYKQEEMRDAHSAVGRAGAIFEYSSGSPVAAWLERYPFLGEAVVQRPEKLQFIATAERPGRWMPDHAVELLVEHAIAESEALAGGGSGFP